MYDPYAHNDDDGKDHPDDVYLDMIDAEKRREKNRRRREARASRNAPLENSQSVASPPLEDKTE